MKDTPVVVDDPHVLKPLDELDAQAREHVVHIDVGHRPKPAISRKLAMLAALAVGMQHMPESARDMVTMPHADLRPSTKPKFVPPKDRAPNTVGMNRKQRRRLAHMVVHRKRISPRPKPPVPKLIEMIDPQGVYRNNAKDPDGDV